ncbi:MAG: ABC transporter ATP-binding protein/permease [Anaeromyxobacteraceae bacterium]
MPRLAARDLAFRYRDREVLSGVSFDVAPGEILGVLGPNGAGKSTLFAILTGLLRPSAGALHLDGAPLTGDGRALRARTGVVFQSPSLDAKLTAEENLVYGALLFGLSRRDAGARAQRLLAAAGLADRARDAAGKLSGGLRRRLELARALVHGPSILLMDEPTSGLDAAAFAQTWDTVAALRRDEGLTVVVATHRPDEAERCDRLAVLSGGRVVACETPERLRSRVSGDVVTVEGDDAPALAREIAARFGVPARAEGGEVRIERDRGHELVPRLVEGFPPGRFRAVALRRPTLADAFLAVTGHGLAEEEATATPTPISSPPPSVRPERSREAAESKGAEPSVRPEPFDSGRAAASAQDRLRSTESKGPLTYDLATALTLAERDLVRFFRQPSRLVGALGQPVLFWLVIGSGMAATFRLPGADVGYLPFFYPGVVMMVVLFAAIFTTVSVIEDRHAGFLQAVLAGPGSRGALALGKVLGSAAVALTQAALFLALAPAAGFALGSVNWPLLVAALALAAVGLGGVAFAVAWAVDSVQGYHAIQMSFLTPLWVVSGAMFPPSPEHPVLAAVMRANPVAYAVSAARRALAGPLAPGALPGSAGRDLAVVAAFALAGVALAVVAARGKR